MHVALTALQKIPHFELDHLGCMGIDSIGKTDTKAAL